MKETAVSNDRYTIDFLNLLVFILGWAYVKFSPRVLASGDDQRRATIIGVCVLTSYRVEIDL